MSETTSTVYPLMLQAIESVSQRWTKLFRQSTIGFCGQVEAELANFLTQSSDSTINVVVRGKVASVRGNERSNEQDDAKLNTIRSLNAAIQQPIVNQLKTKPAGYLPVCLWTSCGGSCHPEEIKNIAARDDVERIYIERVAEPRLNVSRVSPPTS